MSSTALDRSLVAYSLASGTGLLVVGSAEAAIVYSGLINHTVTFGSSYNLDFDGGGTDLSVHYALNGSNYQARVGGTANAGLAYQGSSSYADSFQSGDLIDGGVGKYGVSNEKLLAEYNGGVLITGNFPADTTAFAGFSVGGTNYGWIRFAMGGPLDGTNTFTVVDWAYDNNGEAIRAGQTSSVPVPGAAALAAFAAGATGLRGWRGRQRAA